MKAYEVGPEGQSRVVVARERKRYRRWGRGLLSEAESQVKSMRASIIESCYCRLK